MTIRKPLKRALGDTEYMLEQWGWWRLDGRGIPVYVSPLRALIRDNVQSVSTIQAYCITDELAVAVDGAVARLSKRDPQMGLFIWLYFGEKWTMLKLGRKQGMSEAKARELVRAGVAWIDCALEDFRAAA